MSLTITPRRAALAILAILAMLCLMVVYLAGGARSPGTSAAALTGAPTTTSSSPPAYSGVSGGGITVSGTGDVAGTPDTLRLDLSVLASAPSVSEALAKANASASAVQSSLLRGGVAKQDLQTSGLNIAPSYDNTSPGTARIKGYDVSEGVIAKLRDLRRAGDGIGGAVAAGGDAVRVNGVSLDLEATGALVAKARDKAFADARAKAEQYAKDSGRPLGDVVSIAENIATPAPVSLPAASMAKAAEVPVQPGSQEVSVTVTVVFAMR